MLLLLPVLHFFRFGRNDNVLRNTIYIIFMSSIGTHNGPHGFPAPGMGSGEALA